MAMNVPALPILQISEFPSYPRVVHPLPPFTVAVLFMDFMPHCQVIKFHPQGLPYTDQFEKFTTVSFEMPIPNCCSEGFSRIYHGMNLSSD